MISKATSSGAWSPDAVANLATRVGRDDVVSTQTVARDEPNAIDLTSVEAWCELIRDIVTMANSGGGRLVVRCVSSGASADTEGNLFSVPIQSTAGRSSAELKPGATDAAPANLQPVRIVTDPNAPALQPQDVDRLYPWRQKDLLRELNNRLGRRMLNSYDIQAVRRQHHLDERPDFVFNLPGAGRRYSPAVADWIMERYERAPEFFSRARAADHEIMKLRRQKPK